MRGNISVRRQIKVLYISYDGMLEPLGESQVLAYLERLAEHADIHLLSFEKEEDWRVVPGRETLTRRIRSAGISWYPLRYHKRFSIVSTSFDIAHGIMLGIQLVQRHQLSIVHARSYVASMIAIAIKRFTAVRFIFDMRGFWPDERVEAGLWPENGRLYRVAKRIERSFLTEADVVICLTYAALKEIASFPYLRRHSPPIFVIPTCVDLKRFSVVFTSTSSNGKFVLGYVGNIRGWYRFSEVAACFALLSVMLPGARLLVVNRGQHDLIRKYLAEAAIDARDTDIISAEHSQMAGIIGRMSAGIMIAKPGYSHIARAPTKLGEFLACGVPCLCSAGIGDVSSLLLRERVGVVLEAHTNEGRREALEELIEIARQPDIATRCARAAEKYFSLQEGVGVYHKIYDRLSREI